MKYFTLIAAVSSLLTGIASAGNWGCNGCPPHSNAPAITLLDRLEARGRELHNYQAHITYIREQQLLGDKQIRTGTITYQAAVAPKPEPSESSPPASDTPDASPAKFAVRFTHLVVNGALREHPRDYVFDGTWLAEIDPENKQFIRRQVVAPAHATDPADPNTRETFDPLQIGQGPFPVPLGQKRDQVLAIFHAVLVDPAENDPANTVHLGLTPRTDEKTGKPLSRFTKISVWYDKDTLLPVKIVADDDSQNTTTVKLSDPKIDQLTASELSQAFDTTPPPAGEGWKIEVKPWESD